MISSFKTRCILIGYLAVSHDIGRSPVYVTVQVSFTKTDCHIYRKRKVTHFRILILWTVRPGILVSDSFMDHGLFLINDSLYLFNIVQIVLFGANRNSYLDNWPLTPIIKHLFKVILSSSLRLVATFHGTSVSRKNIFGGIAYNYNDTSILSWTPKNGISLSHCTTVFNFVQYIIHYRNSKSAIAIFHYHPAAYFIST